jgi:hypothetical protein
MRFLWISIIVLLLSCAQRKHHVGDTDAHRAFEGNAHLRRDSSETKIPEKKSIVSLFKMFEKISETDSVTDLLVRTGKFSEETPDGIYTTVMDIDSTKNDFRIEST